MEANDLETIISIIESATSAGHNYFNPRAVFQNRGLHPDYQIKEDLVQLNLSEPHGSKKSPRTKKTGPLTIIKESPEEFFTPTIHTKLPEIEQEGFVLDEKLGVYVGPTADGLTTIRTTNLMPTFFGLTTIPQEPGIIEGEIEPQGKIVLPTESTLLSQVVSTFPEVETTQVQTTQAPQEVLKNDEIRETIMEIDLEQLKAGKYRRAKLNELCKDLGIKCTNKKMKEVQEMLVTYIETYNK
jgi:hypothetical protein